MARSHLAIGICICVLGAGLFAFVGSDTVEADYDVIGIMNDGIKARKQEQALNQKQAFIDAVNELRSEMATLQDDISAIQNELNAEARAGVEDLRKLKAIRANLEAGGK